MKLKRAGSGVGSVSQMYGSIIQGSGSVPVPKCHESRTVACTHIFLLKVKRDVNKQVEYRR
jgi:hypothetical protein